MVSSVAPRLRCGPNRLAMLLCFLLASIIPGNGHAQNEEAEKYKVPVEATIQAKHNLGSDAIGNVVVTYDDGTTDIWTLKGNCKMPKVSSRGAVGWVVCETLANSNSLKLYDGLPIGSRLAVNFRGHIIATLNAAKPFIEDWAFEADGLHVVLKSRAAHGSAVIERFGLHDGPPESAVEAYQENLPVWARAFGEGSSSDGSALAPSEPERGENQENAYLSAVAQGTRIIRTKIIPQYETKGGFNVKPMELKYDSDPTIAQLEHEYGSIWKRFDPVVADAYTEIQRRSNEETRPEGNRYRSTLRSAFDEAVALRGGGSASVQLSVFAPAQAEWIIAHLGATEYKDVSDEEFVSRLTSYLTVGSSPQLRDVKSVLGKLNAIGRLLDRKDTAFLKAEFLAYFGQ